MTYVEKFHKTSKKIQVFETVRFVKMVQRGYEEILKNQHFYDFRTCPGVNNSQQVLTKIISVEKCDISAF